jgi:3-oxoacid CoA-transferase
VTIDEVWPTPAPGMAAIPHGALVAIAGFGVSHSFPPSLIVTLRAEGTKPLTLVAHSLGLGHCRSIALAENRLVRRLVASGPALSR